MAAVNEWVVREYFECLGYLVMQPQKHKVMARTKRLEEDVDLLAVNPQVTTHQLPDHIIWTAADLKHVPRAIIGVRGWHTDRFSASVIKLSPEVVRFASDDVVKRFAPMVGVGPVARILCVSGLPASGALKKKATEALRENGIDGVILFRTMLQELVRRVDVNKNYEKSDLLQILRLLKNYDLLQKEQLELFGRKRRKKANG